MTDTKEKDVLILAIESSCDETAAAVVKNGREVLSNVIYSQIDLHTLYGGVVPEIASRKHIEKINQVVRKALADASCTLDDITAVAVTYGPGLVGALLVGVAEAKAIAFAANKQRADFSLQTAAGNNGPIGVRVANNRAVHCANGRKGRGIPNMQSCFDGQNAVDDNFSVHCYASLPPKYL